MWEREGGFAHEAAEAGAVPETPAETNDSVAAHDVFAADPTDGEVEDCFPAVMIVSTERL